MDIELMNEEIAEYWLWEETPDWVKPSANTNSNTNETEMEEPEPELEEKEDKMEALV